MRYLVRARVRPGGEYLRNMQDARLCPDGAARWVEVCYGPTPLQAPPTAANAETMPNDLVRLAVSATPAHREWPEEGFTAPGPQRTRTYSLFLG